VPVGEDTKKIKITIIDDEKELVDTIKELLESRDYSVSFAYNGRSGLEVIKKEKPDLIILDVMMPDMDGRDMLSAIKRDKDTRDVPIIMLTAKSEQIDRDQSLQLGAYEYITKPYDSYYLLRQIDNVLGKSKKGEL